ncbi:MAG: diadenylate cyclase CdaA [Candidatus Aminicenantes bacterium]|nr:diadenylate cyclase CdaA [Candidatus Aminicenantes bacterium]
MPPNILSALLHITLADVMDILLLTLIFYSLFVLIKDTKAYQMAIGLGVIGLLFLITRWGNLRVTNRIIANFTTYFIIAIIVLFQGEIRRFLTTIGSRSFRNPLSLKSFKEKQEDLTLAVDYLATNKIGALIAIEKEISLKSFIDQGTRIDAVLTKDLLVSIFFPHSPLHDGAVIIRGNKIAAAGCLLPLPSSHNLGNEFKPRTRHLAAIGLSQETDAAVIVVSEETGQISLAVKGQLRQRLEKEQLNKLILDYLRNT